MAGKEAEVMPNNEKPQVILSSRRSFVILNPDAKRKVALELSPDWTKVVSAGVFSIAPTKEEKEQIEIQFTGLTRAFISAKLKQKSYEALKIDTSDAIGTEMESSEAEGDIRRLVENMIEIGYTEKEIVSRIRTQGRLFRNDRQSVVNEIVVGLTSSLFQKEEENAEVRINKP